MPTLGCHLSASKGFLHMAREAMSIGANSFQFFTRNPRGGSAKPLDPEDIAAFHTCIAEHAFGQVLAHAPYSLNPCSSRPEVLEFARMVMADDLKRMEAIPGNLYNFHPGCHVGQGLDTGVALIADLLNRNLRPDMPTTILLETMSGKATEVGGRFEELRAIIDRVEHPDCLGVCLDTCHVHDAGYDIVHDLDGVLTAFDRIVGLERLKALHINDSMNPMGSHKDRHAKLGEGCIGLEALLRVVSHPALRKLPMLLETPNELDGYAREIAILKEHLA